MKTLSHNVTQVLLLLFFLTPLISTAQILFEDRLATIYLDHTVKEVVYTNNFSSYNEHLIEADELNFRIEVRQAKKNSRYLLFISERNTLEVLATTYLKILRKGANRSNDAEAFKVFLHERLPALIYQFRKDNNLEILYQISRKHTLNGKIDALPPVL